MRSPMPPSLSLSVAWSFSLELEVVDMAGAVLLLLDCFFILLVTPRAVVAANTAGTAPTPTVCASSAGTTPVILGEPLPFCGNTGISCCDAAEDDALREELDAMNVPDATCADIIKSFLCKRCRPSLSYMFSSVAPTKLSVPPLCGSAQAQPAAGTGSTATRPAQEQDTSSSTCLERISAASFHTMTAHPDGSGRVFLTRRDSKLWLATMPGRGAGAALRINDDVSARRRQPFLDLIGHDGVLWVVGVAFHPEFTTNGRFFVSYICDGRSISPPACGGASAGNGSRPFRYHLVVTEFSAEGGAGSDFSKATRADPSEVRRIFTLGLPQPQYKLYSYQRHGGQILFRPSIDSDRDNYLYLITGYGYSSNTKHNDSSSGSFFGKILRFNVDNGSVGGSEPWTDTDRHSDGDDKPEMFAAGLNNPSACSFDSDRPSHLLCADVDEQRFERVYLITEKQLDGASRSSSSSVANVSVVVDHGRPADGRMPSIVGGLVYRGSAEPSLKGRYLYVYASGVWSRRYASTQSTYVHCSWSSPVPCGSGIGNGIIGSRVLSMAEDNNKDAFFLTTAGVFRVVPPGACRAPRPQPEWPPGTASGSGSGSGSGSAWLLSVGATAVALALYVCWKILGGGGETSLRVGCCIFKSISISVSSYYRDYPSDTHQTRQRDE